MAPPLHTSSGAVSGWVLVAAAQAGDTGAFAELYRRYLPVVSGYIARRVPDRHDAEDLAAETFTRALRSIATARNQGRDVAAWLLAIARNLVVDRAKSHRVRRQHLLGDVTTLTDRAGFGPDPEQIVLARLDAAELRRQVAALPQSQRDVLRLRMARELTVPQTADVLGTTGSAVKALQHRAVVRLRQVGGWAA